MRAWRECRWAVLTPERPPLEAAFGAVGGAKSKEKGGIDQAEKKVKIKHPIFRNEIALLNNQRLRRKLQWEL